MMRCLSAEYVDNCCNGFTQVSIMTFIQSDISDLELPLYLCTDVCMCQGKVDNVQSYYTRPPQHTYITKSLSFCIHSDKLSNHVVSNYLMEFLYGISCPQNQRSLDLYCGQFNMVYYVACVHVNTKICSFLSGCLYSARKCIVCMIANRYLY